MTDDETPINLNNISLNLQTNVPINSTKYVALDAEYVETINGKEPLQVSILDYDGNVIFNRYFKPTADVVEMRQPRKTLLKKLKSKLVNYADYKNDIVTILKDKVIIGHDLIHDIRALGLNPDEFKIVDTAYLPPFMTNTKKSLSLKILTKLYLNRNIQSASKLRMHNARENAKAALNLVRTYNVNMTGYSLKNRKTPRRLNTTLKKRNGTEVLRSHIKNNNSSFNKTVSNNSISKNNTLDNYTHKRK